MEQIADTARYASTVLTTSFSISHLPTIAYMAEYLKAAGTRTIGLGGQAVTFLHKTGRLGLLENMAVDGIYLGESNKSVTEFVARLGKTEDLLIFDGRGKAGCFADGYDFKRDTVRKIAHLKDKGFALVGYVSLTDGCPWRCDFCAASVTKAFSKREGYAKELEFLLSEGIDDIYITDLTFGLGMDGRDVSALQRLKGRYPHFSWRAVTRPDVLVEKCGKHLEGLKRAGLREIGLGIESFSNNGELIKNSALNEMGECLRLLWKTGIGIRFLMMFGHPSFTLSDIRSTFGFLARAEDRFIIQPSFYRNLYDEIPFESLDFRADVRNRLPSLSLSDYLAIKSYLWTVVSFDNTETGSAVDNAMGNRIVDILLPRLPWESFLGVSRKAGLPDELAAIVFEGTFTLDDIRGISQERGPKADITGGISNLREWGAIFTLRDNITGLQKLPYPEDVRRSVLGERGFLIWTGKKFVAYIPKDNLSLIGSSLYDIKPEDASRLMGERVQI
jgi:hypothetical protein